MSAATKSSSPSVAPAKMPRDLAAGVDGVVEFNSRAGSSYRYQIIVKDDKLRIWLEDRSTKKQWQTADLAMSDFVTKDCVIPHSTFTDYVMCFIYCMESATTSDDFSRVLVKSKTDSDAWELRLMLKLRVFTATWTPTYSFQLLPVPLELVDLLAAKIRDLEELIEQLHGKVGAMESKPKTPEALVSVRAKTGKQFTANQVLTWKADEATSSVQFLAGGKVRFMVPGLFVVNIVVHHSNSNGASAFDVQLNSTTVLSCYGSNPNGYQQTSTVNYVLQAAPKDEITVMLRGNGSAYADSSISIHQLR